MPENLLIPSVDLRIASLEEYNRRQKQRVFDPRPQGRIPPCITISREFGCEAYPVAERLRELMMQRSGEEWVVMDKALLEEVARRHNVSEEVLATLGERNRILTEVLATFSQRWKCESDHFRLLSSHIISLAAQGNVIIVGRGSAIITRHMENCYHFKLYASLDFKTRSIARRLNMSSEEAARLIERKQAQRDRFTSSFLAQDANDVSHYHLLLNNDRNSTEKIAVTLADYVSADYQAGQSMHQAG